MDTFSIKDQAAWDKWRTNNTDPYGSAIIRYAARWAAMMEERMRGGQKLEDVAEDASYDAEDRITDPMYGAAVTVLASCWEHGEALRRWHNRSTQLHDE